MKVTTLSAHEFVQQHYECKGGTDLACTTALMQHYNMTLEQARAFIAEVRESHV